MTVFCKFRHLDCDFRSSRYTLNMIRKIQLTIVTVLLFLTSSPLPALAHMLDSGEEVIVLLHLSPSDNPVIGEPAVLEFTASNEESTFAFELCDCSVSVSYGTTTEALPATAFISRQGSMAQVSYVFATADTYRIMLSGKPLGTAHFESFKVIFDEEISNDGSGFSLPHLHSGHGLHFAAFGTVFAVFFALEIRNRVKTARAKKATL